MRDKCANLGKGSATHYCLMSFFFSSTGKAFQKKMYLCIQWKLVYIHPLHFHINAAGCLKSISHISYSTIWKGLGGEIVGRLNESFRDLCTKTAQIGCSFATDNSLKTQLQ